MERHELTIGERIVFNELSHKELVGKEGEIICIEDDGVAGIKLDEMLYLHDCNGKCEPGYGWYEKAEAMDALNTTPVCRLSIKDKELTKAIKKTEPIKVNEETYTIKKNGALLIAEKADKKVIAINTISKQLMFLNCKTENDVKLSLHILDLYKVAEMKTIKNINGKFELKEYTQEEFDKFVESVTPKDEVEEMTPPPVVVEEKKAQEFQTEEELYASLGIKL